MDRILSFRALIYLFHLLLCSLRILLVRVGKGQCTFSFLWSLTLPFTSSSRIWISPRNTAMRLPLLVPHIFKPFPEVRAGCDLPGPNLFQYFAFISFSFLWILFFLQVFYFTLLSQTDLIFLLILYTHRLMVVARSLLEIFPDR